MTINRPQRYPTPWRGLGEGASVTALIAAALWLERVPLLALLLLVFITLAAAVAVALRHRDAPSRRAAVALARVATWWNLVVCIPGAALLALVVGPAALLLPPASVVLAPIGTFLLRERCDVAALALKLAPLLLLAVALILYGPGWFLALGLGTVALAIALLIATIHAHREGSRSAVAMSRPVGDWGWTDSLREDNL